MENGLELDVEPLFEPKLLKQLDWASRKSTFKDGVSPSNPGESLCMRPLCMADYDRGFIHLLSQLTLVGEVSEEAFKKQYEAMKSCTDTYYIIVIEDTGTNQIVGTATLVVERKFIHTAGCRGRIEDVVVNSDYRGKQLGKLLVETATLLGKLLGCYKLTLECKEKNVTFYESFGYTSCPEVYMAQRYKE